FNDANGETATTSRATGRETSTLPITAKTSRICDRNRTAKRGDLLAGGSVLTRAASPAETPAPRAPAGDCARHEADLPAPQSCGYPGDPAAWVRAEVAQRAE